MGRTTWRLLLGMWESAWLGAWLGTCSVAMLAVGGGAGGREGWRAWALGVAAAGAGTVAVGVLEGVGAGSKLFF